MDESDMKQLLSIDNNKNVSHPSYYNVGNIEVGDFIEDQNLNFNRGSVIKYVCRAGLKSPDKEVEDLEKAIVYLKREIKRVCDKK